MGTAFYYLGQPLWNTTEDPANPFWDLPPGVNCMLDLRPIPQHAPGGGGFVIFPSNVEVPGALLLGHSLADKCTLPTRQQMKAMMQWDADIDDITVRDIIWEAYTSRSDPSGQAFNKPLMPSPEGEWSLHIAGHSKVKSKMAVPGDPEFAVSLELMQRDFKKAHDYYYDNNRGHLRKHLAVLLRTWGRFGIGKDEVQERVERGKRLRPKNPSTTLNETWPADGAVTSSQDQAWTVTAGTFAVSSNQLTCSVAGLLRCDTALSSVDHYSEVDVLTTRGNKAGATQRFASGAVTCYSARDQSTSQIRVQEFTAGTGSTLVNRSDSTAVPFTLRQSITGTTLEQFVDAGSLGTHSDSTHSGGDQCGIFGGAASVSDNWESSDGLSGGSVAPKVIQAYRRINAA